MPFFPPSGGESEFLGGTYHQNSNFQGFWKFFFAEPKKSKEKEKKGAEGKKGEWEGVKKAGR